MKRLNFRRFRLYIIRCNHIRKVHFPAIITPKMDKKIGVECQFPTS